MNNIKKTTARVGLFGIGLECYWAQFDGLLERLTGYQCKIARQMEAFGADVLDVGLVDSPEHAVEAGNRLKAGDVDILFLFVSTYALSSTVLPVVKKVKCPLIILNIQPVAALDYDRFNAMGDRGKMTGEWLAHCQACSVPELANVFNRAGIHYEFVTGYLTEPGVWEEIRDWIDATQVLVTLRGNRLGVMGHYYCGMLDVYSDLTKQAVAFGTHIELLEMCELKRYRDAATDEEVNTKLIEFQQTFEVVEACDKDELIRAARTSVALDKLVETHNLGSMAYYYEGQPGNDYECIVTSVIAGNTLLTGKNVPVAGECEVKNAQAMKIMDAFGVGGSFSEFYTMDFNDDIVMLGHDGPAHFAIAEGKVQLVPLPVYHGKPGKGLSIQMTVKQGPVTLLSVVEGREDVFLLVAEGASVDGPTLQIGNTNSRYRFPMGARQFIHAWSRQGPSHHCAIGVGHIANKIEKLGSLLGLRVVRIA